MGRHEAIAILRLVAAVVVATLGVNLLLSGYWVFLFTSAVITAIALQGVGLVVGRAGLISLCQMSFAAIGAWVVAWLNVAHAPGTLLLWTLIGGLAAVPFGVAIGLPALRLRGINLAIVTLGFAAAFDVVLLSYTFPGQTRFIFVTRPALFASDQAYLALCAGVFTLVAAGLMLLNNRPVGAAWLAIRNSERAAAGLGVSVPRAKLSAFALSAFISGLSGGLMAGQLGTLVADSFGLMTSLTAFVVATMAGAHYAEGALFGGVLTIFFPELLRRIGLPQDIGNMLFAVGATHALSSGGSFADDVRGLIARRVGRRVPQPVPAAAQLPAPATAGGQVPAQPVLSVRNLAIHYGAVAALKDVSFDVPARAVVGLIGPNGAGKSSLIDAVTGFLHGYGGSILLEGRPLEGLSAHRRARAGLRRSWQQTRISTRMTVGQYVMLSAGRRLAADELTGLLAFTGCPGPDTPVASIDVGTRRLLDVAGTLAGRPKIVLLDEPAAGLSHAESVELGRRIAEIPDRFGLSVLLVEHDMDLVRQACPTAVVLDFGRVIAAGPTGAVLNDPHVLKAYLGDIDETSEEDAA